jgi:hypothetical protein
MSLKNLRKSITQVDLTQKKLQITTMQMKRTSYLSELEFTYVFGLRCKLLPMGMGSNFFILI